MSGTPKAVGTVSRAVATLSPPFHGWKEAPIGPSPSDLDFRVTGNDAHTHRKASRYYGSALPFGPITLDDNWQDRAAWDKFVEGHDQGRFCHLFDYGEVVRCYGYQPVRLGFVSDGWLVAALPASLAVSILFGRKLVSQPFSEYGGLLVDPALGPGEIDEIYDLLDDYMRRHAKIRVLEMHGNHGIAPRWRQIRFAAQNPHHVAILSLDRPLDELWHTVVQHSVRKGVNKAIGHGVEAFEECSEAILRERFYPLYLRSMKRLGVPPHSLAYFLGCLEFLGDRLKIFWATRDNEFLAGLLGFVSGGRVNITNIVSDANAWRYGPNDAIHWAFIKWAVESQLKFFDFGSVRYEGQRTYKKKWGTIFEEHAHYFQSPDLKKVTRSTFSSSAPGLSHAAKLWSNHMPNKIAQLAGPLIRKHLVR